MANGPKRRRAELLQYKNNCRESIQYIDFDFCLMSTNWDLCVALLPLPWDHLIPFVFYWMFYPSCANQAALEMLKIDNEVFISISDLLKCLQGHYNMER